jgi:hypothetical protein
MVTDILTDSAPKTILDCASGRTSLRAATPMAISRRRPGAAHTGSTLPT